MRHTAHARNYDFPHLWWIERVVDDTRLSSSARHLAHVLWMVADDGRITATLARLSNLTGLRAFETIISARNELERAGYIRLDRSGARRIDAIVLVGEFAS